MLKVIKRAETSSKEHIVSTFVDVGPLFTLLSSLENQILFGRRGTGKTHALSYLENYIENQNDIPIMIDLRNMGSSGGVYSDTSLTIPERATSLLVDVLQSLHDSLLDYVIEDENTNLAMLGPVMDDLAFAITEVKVIGNVEIEDTSNNTRNENESDGFGLAFDQTLKLNLDYKNERGQESSNERRVQRSGREVYRVHFGTFRKFFSKVVNSLNPKRIWILLDEWSEVPIDLQPYLADLLKRTLLSVPGVSTKIAAIEQRCNFRITNDTGLDVGLEIGADAAASLNLDEYMVFDNNSENAKQFFGQLIYKHVVSSLKEDEAQSIENHQEFIRMAFTRSNTFDEFVKAAEGVPRDAINILSRAAQRAQSLAISMIHIRDAAKIWYSQSKEKAITSRPGATILLQWLIDEVIGHRRARAFLIRNDVRDPLIDFLFDSRVLHVIKQSVSSNETPGVRYMAYSIDYGCYVDLINTSRSPQGLFEVDSDEGSTFVEVPSNDYRAIRRAILDLKQFRAFLNNENGLE